jgi:phosphatidylinositol glycan class B
MNALPPFSLVYIIAIIIYIIYRPKDVITWIIVPFLLAHFMIAHKELRFIFSIIGFLPIMIISSAEIILEKTGYGFADRKVVKVFVKAFWYTNLIMLGIIMFRPADDHISLYKKLYFHYTSPTILYCIEDNPYHRVENINFYKRKDLVVKQVTSINMIDPGKDTTTLFATNKPGLPYDNRFKFILIYSSFPDWVKNFNINNWIERTYFWYIYELKKVSS